MDFLIHMHSVMRWLLLISLIAALFNIYKIARSGGKVLPQDKTIHLLTLILTHLQFLMGLILYIGNQRYAGFSHMDVPVSRFLAVEHGFGMIIAIGLITVAFGKVKSCITHDKIPGKIWIWYLIALLIILASIPWPFRGPGFDIFGYY